MRTSLTMTLMVAAMLSGGGCGTVAGNPRKPNTGSDPIKAVVYALPTLDFDLSDESLQLTASGLQLAAFDSDGTDKSLFNAVGRRFNSLIRQVNTTTTRLNKILSDQAKQDADGKTVRFNKAGPSSKLSAVVGPSDVAPYSHAAVVCADGKPLQLLRWSDDSGSLELWRDFSLDQGEGDASYGITSRIRLSKTASGATSIDIASYGTWSDSSDSDADDGGGLSERLIAERDEATGIIALRSATDRFTGDAPKQFTPDVYVSSRLYPRSHGVKGYDTAFVGYSKAAKRLRCRGGFDESATDLWHPTVQGPRFCLGRAANGEPLKTFDDFSALVTSFESVGIIKKAQLESITMPSGLNCGP